MIASLFSRPCTYALRAMSYLAAQPGGKLTGKRDIAQSESIPSAFLSKVLLSLCQSHVLRSRKGLRGGYELALPAEHISLLTIVRCIDGEPFGACLLEDRPCSGTHPCELHASWTAVRQELFSYLESVSAADLVRLRRIPPPQQGGGIPAARKRKSRRTDRGE